MLEEALRIERNAYKLTGNSSLRAYQIHGHQYIQIKFDGK